MTQHAGDERRLHGAAAFREILEAPPRGRDIPIVQCLQDVLFHRCMVALENQHQLRRGPRSRERVAQDRRIAADVVDFVEPVPRSDDRRVSGDGVGKSAVVSRHLEVSAPLGEEEAELRLRTRMNNIE